MKTIIILMVVIATSLSASDYINGGNTNKHIESGNNFRFEFENIFEGNKLILWNSNTGTELTITDKIPNSSVVVWEVPDELTEANIYKLKIVDSEGNVEFITKNFFTIFKSKKEKSIETSISTNKLNLSPNPFINTIEIKLDNKWNKLEIIDLVGVKINEFDVRGMSELIINTSNYSHGVYIVRVKNKNETSISKIIK